MKDCLILLGMGGPDSVKSIPTFLYNLFSDREIINFHIGDIPQKMVAKIIAKKRGERIAPSYIKMGLENGASPQNYWTDKLIKKLPPLYNKRHKVKLDCFAAMCYFKPYIEDTLKLIEKTNYRKIYLLPLYPQYSMTTTGALINRIAKSDIFHKAKAGNIILINEWYQNNLYNAALVKRIEAAAKQLKQDIKNCHVIFTAHSVPLSYIKKGDEYPIKIQHHVELLCKLAGIKSHEISYQSKVGPVKWLAPATKNRLNSLRKERKDNVIIMPISFISDHIETLIELDEELLYEYKADGLKIIRTESLNDSSDFLESIIDIISE